MKEQIKVPGSERPVRLSQVVGMSRYDSLIFTYGQPALSDSGSGGYPLPGSEFDSHILTKRT